MNKRKFPVTNIGSVSLLMIFIVLCMVTLAALSLSTASGSYRSAQTLAGHTTAYYRACQQSREKACKDREDPAGMLSFHFRCRQLLSTGASTLGITGSDGSLIYSFQTAVNKSQELEVRIQITYPDSSATAGSDREDSDTASAFYKITCWKMTSTSDWNADNSNSINTIMIKTI